MHGSIPARFVSLATEIKSEHELHLQKSRESAAHAIHAGELLIAAKLTMPHSVWGPWLRRHVGFSGRTARVYMQLARRVADLSPAKRQSAADLSQARVLELIGRKTEPSSFEHYTPEEIMQYAESIAAMISRRGI